MKPWMILMGSYEHLPDRWSDLNSHQRNSSHTVRSQAAVRSRSKHIIDLQGYIVHASHYLKRRKDTVLMEYVAVVLISVPKGLGY